MRREILAGILGIEPDGLVRECGSIAEEIGQEVGLGDVEMFVYRLERHCESESENEAGWTGWVL